MTIEADLAAMNTTLDDLIPKQDGNLVRANDWNTLVEQLKVLGGIVATQQTELGRLDDMYAQLAALDGRVTSIENLLGTNDNAGSVLARLQDLEANKLDRTTFEQYQATLDPLLLQYTVTLATDDTHYLLGEVATLTATVRRLDGSAVTTRPWLDFLVSWGDIQAVSGFDTRPGAGGRSVSVRTDTSGVARVRIKAETLASTSDTIDGDMSAFFATEISTQGQSKSMRQAVLDAANPQDNFMPILYAQTTQRYDAGTASLQYVADKYYQGKYRVPDRDLWFPTGRWNDHRATIAVFAKDDSDPQTPDFGKGVSAIQINFRDWVGPWINDYQPDLPHVEDWPWVVEIPDILRDPQYNPDILIDYLDDHMDGLGLIGKHKVLESVGAAMGRAGGQGINPNAGPLINVVKDAVKTQKTLDLIAYDDNAGISRGLSAVAQAVQHAAGTGNVQGQVLSMGTQVSDIGSKASSLESSYSVLNSRVNESTAQGENMMLALGSIDSKVGNINIVDADSVRGSVSAIKADIAALRFNLER